MTIYKKAQYKRLFLARSTSQAVIFLPLILNNLLNCFSNNFLNQISACNKCECC